MAEIQFNSFYKNMRNVNHIHFVGIGGAGMCGIAEILLKQGYTVSGSDMQIGATVQRLEKLGASIFNNHTKSNIHNADVVVKSSAIKEANPEIVGAYQASVPVIHRAEMLAELMRFQWGIAVAGTHGKTTTTSLVASVLLEGGLDPSFVIGGKLKSVESNAHLGASDIFVAEADESDASFLYLKPVMTIVTNIDAEHLTSYDNNFRKLTAAFVKYIQQLPFYGLAVLCADDAGVQTIVDQVKCPKLTYGFNKNADLYVNKWEQRGTQNFFTVKRYRNYPDLPVTLNLPGRHNVLNALAAIAIASELGVADTAIQRALSQFEGVGRRFHLYGKLSLKQGEVLLIDDYGHHPWEILVTIQAIRNAWPNKRLIHIFQPHRYSRTQTLFKDFIKVLAQADLLLLLEIYAAGEDPIPGVDSRRLLDKINQNTKVESIYIPSEVNLASILNEYSRAGDIILTQGAGSIGVMAAELAKQYGSCHL